MKHALFCAIAAFFAVLSSAAAAAVPLTLSQNGFLTDDQGRPVSAALPFAFNIYLSPDGNDLVWGEDVPDVVVTGGHYSVTLGTNNSLKDVFNSRKDIYLEIVVNGQKVTPRQKIRAVPYALVAGDLVGDIHPKSVTAGGKTTIDETGKWVGDTSGFGDVTGVTTTPPLGGGGSSGELTIGVPKAGDSADGYVSSADWNAFFGLQNRVTAACQADQVAGAIAADGTVACVSTIATTIGDISSVATTLPLTGGRADGDVLLSLPQCTAASDGYLSAADWSAFNNKQSLITGVCAAGSSIREVMADGTVTCEGDDDTIYAAGAGIGISGAAISLDETGCEAFDVQKRNVGNSGWECVPDEDTHYSAGAGLVQSGTTFLLPATCGQNTVQRWTGAEWVCSAYAPGWPFVQSVTASAPLVSSGGYMPTISLARASAAEDGYLAASDWAAFDAMQNRISGFCGSGRYIRVVNQDGTAVCAVDASSTYTAGSGIELNGYTFSLPLTCAVGNMLKWDGAVWTCVADESSDGTVFQVDTGAGLAGGPITTMGTISLAGGYQDGSSYDGRFVNESQSNRPVEQRDDGDDKRRDGFVCRHRGQLLHGEPGDEEGRGERGVGVRGSECGDGDVGEHERASDGGADNWDWDDRDNQGGSRDGRVSFERGLGDVQREGGCDSGWSEYAVLEGGQDVAGA